MASGVSLRAFIASTFALDGGAMHGVVPRVLWERTHRADAKHRIALAARVLLVEHAPSGSRTLVDLGMGQRWTDAERERYAVARGDELPALLRREGLDPESITHVVLTHLHWDHAGGLVRADGDHPTLAFPRAEHVASELALAHANSPTDKDQGSYHAADLAPLFAPDARLRAWRPGEPLAPGLEGRLSHGHTAGLVIPMARYRDDGPPLAMPTDLIPTRSHLRAAWVMAYDNEPLRSVDEKKALVSELARIGGGVALYHDAWIEAAWAVDGPKGPELVPGALDGTRGGSSARTRPTAPTS